MALLMFALPIVILALVAVAIYEHVSSVTLSLPLSPALTFLTILLPLLAAANVVTLPYLTNKSSRSSSSAFRHINPVALETLLGILTTVLATLYSTDLIPSATRGCELSTRWQHLFRTKDAQAIRAIQEALQCCGFRTVKDMAWPFPPTEVQCAARFDRALACEGPWTAALQRNAGANFGVVLAVGLLQVVGIIIARQYAGRSSAFSWSNVFQHWTQRSGLGGPASRPLLTGHDGRVEEVNEEIEESGRGNARRYGATEDSGTSGSRVLPSGLQPERNQWEDA